MKVVDTMTPRELAQWEQSLIPRIVVQCRTSGVVWALRGQALPRGCAYCGAHTRDEAMRERHYIKLDGDAPAGADFSRPAASEPQGWGAISKEASDEGGVIGDD